MCCVYACSWFEDSEAHGTWSLILMEAFNSFAESAASNELHQWWRGWQTLYCAQVILIQQFDITCCILHVFINQQERHWMDWQNHIGWASLSWVSEKFFVHQGRCRSTCRTASSFCYINHVVGLSCRDWGQRFNRLYPQYSSWENTKEPDRPLKIGYISPDYFTHSVSYFIEAPIMHHDYRDYRVIVYSAVVKVC